MTPKAGLGKALKFTRVMGTGKLTCLLIQMLRMLGCEVILQCLTSGTLIITMLTLVLKRACVLCLDVHVNGALILFRERTVRALKLSILCTNILKGHADLSPRHFKIHFFPVYTLDVYE